MPLFKSPAPNMGPNSRPPLTRRIRDSLDGSSKRARSRDSQNQSQDPLGSHPPNGFIPPPAQDADTLRAAVDAAINSETFQMTIAANLAKLINPSITTALDTIQPLIESVCSHEVLLKKTSRSVEHILDRVDAGLPSHKSSRMDSDNGIRLYSRTENDYDAGVTPVPEVFTTPGEHPNYNQDYKSPNYNPPNTHPSQFADYNSYRNSTQMVHDAVRTAPAHNLEDFKELLDENNARTAASLAELSKSAEANNSKITEISHGVAYMHTFFHPMKVSIDALKSKSDQANSGPAIHGQLDQMRHDIEGMHTEMSTMRGNLNGSAEFMADSFGKLADAFSTVLATIEGHSTTLSEIKNAPPHSKMLELLHKSNSSHAAHAAVLGELKDRSINSTGRSSDFTTAIDRIRVDMASLKDRSYTCAGRGPDLQATLDKMRSDLASVKDRLPNSDQSGDLTSLRDRSMTSHAGNSVSSPTTVKRLSFNATEGLDVTVAIDRLRSDLASLKATTLTRSIDNGKIDAVDAKFGNVVATLNAHTATLDKIVKHKDILEDIKGLQFGHATALEGIKSTGTAHGDILGDIRDAHEAHATSLEELKGLSESHANVFKSSCSQSDAPTTSDRGLMAQMTSLADTLSTHTSHLQYLKSNLHTLPASPSADVSSDAITSVMETLEMHTTFLTEIKDDIAAEILTSLHDLGEADSNHTTMLTDLREADVSAEILTLLHASNESHAKADAQLRYIAAGVGRIQEWELEGSLEAINVKIGELGNAVESHFEAHTEKLDRLKKRAVPSMSTSPVAADTSALGEKIGGLAKKMDENHAALAYLHTAHTASLNEIKSRSVETLAAADSTALQQRIDKLAANIDGHNVALSELHAAHGLFLDEIKHRLTNTPDPDNCALEEKLRKIASKLDDQHTTLESIHETAGKSRGMHLAHASSLSDLQSRSSQPSHDTSSLEEKLTSIQTTLDEHRSTLHTIKDNTEQSLESHLDHTTALNEIQEASLSSVDSHTNQAATLEHIKTMATANQETHVKALGDTREAIKSHASALLELQTAQSKHIGFDRAPPSPDIAGMGSHITSILSTLEAQTSTLAEIKESTAITPEILTQVKGSHELLTSHTTLLEGTQTGINEQGALVKDLQDSPSKRRGSLLFGIAGAFGGAAGAEGAVLASDDQELLKSIHEIVSQTSTVTQTTSDDLTSMKSQLDIKHTLTTSITTLSDELKAKIDVTGTDIINRVGKIDNAPLTTKVDDMMKNGIRLSNKGIEQLQQHIETPIVDLSVDLSEGVHLSERGLTQLEANLAYLVPPSDISELLGSQFTAGVHLNATGVSQLHGYFSGSEAGDAVDARDCFANSNRGSAELSPASGTLTAVGIALTAKGLVSSGSFLETVHEADEESPERGDFPQHRVNFKEIEAPMASPVHEGPFPSNEVDDIKYLDENGNETMMEDEKGEFEGVGRKLQRYMKDATATPNASRQGGSKIPKKAGKGKGKARENKGSEMLENWSIIDHEDDPSADNKGKETEEENDNLSTFSEAEASLPLARKVSRGESDKENHKTHSSPTGKSDGE